MSFQRYSSQCSKSQSTGFSLVELAIVLVIVALLLGGLLMTLGAQQEVQARNNTERKISEVMESIIGFAAANGRLPCPASAGSTGVEKPDGGGSCTSPYDGFVPAITLGIGPTDANGYLLDSWGNPIRYAVTTSNTSAFTTSGQISMIWRTGTLQPDLRVCSTSAGSSLTACDTNKELITTGVAIVFSRATNGGVVPSSADEIANGDPDQVFVSHTPTPMGTGTEFDDIVTWLSPNVLYSRMIAAGRLP